MEHPDFQDYDVACWSMNGALPQPHLQFHAMYTIGRYANIFVVFKLTPCTCIILWFQFQWLYTCPTLSHAPIYQIGGTCDSKGGAGPVTFGEARDTGMHSVWVDYRIFLLHWLECGLASSPGKLDSLGTCSPRPIKHMQDAFVHSIQLLLSKLAY